MIRILYWNIGGLPDCLREVVESKEEYDILAIQEPVKKRGPTQLRPRQHYRLQPLPTAFIYPYCPASCNYNLIYGGPGGRIAIYIHKRYPPSIWDSEAYPDWCRITLFGIRIYSIYFPVPGTPDWATPLQDLYGP